MSQSPTRIESHVPQLPATNDSKQEDLSSQTATGSDRQHEAESKHQPVTVRKTAITRPFPANQSQSSHKELKRISRQRIENSRARGEPRSRDEFNNKTEL
ncbi:hypothetical protein A2U01_0006599 [Trifolium medium]|uniref:Uncharacterized protein n=1 Tax=Trifolium medium TaxID=97028 RepID=A0A392MFC7_9FABA|nr:hypothetical protein [Trifolium medium]